MIRFSKLTCVAIVVVFAAEAQAINIFWQGGTGNLTDSNYSDGTNTNLAPQSTDVLFLGNSGTITHAVAGITQYQKLRVGHDLTPPGGVGPATLTVNNGAQLSLTTAGAGADASLIIGAGSTTAGSGASGTLNIDGAGSSVTSAQLVQIGFGGASTASATVNITNGGALVAFQGNINLGERNTSTTSGIPGHLDISGAGSTLTIATASADLNIGVRATSTYEQTDGTVSIGDAVNVGQNGAQNSSFEVSGGTFTAGGTITVGDNNAHGSSFKVSGGTVESQAIVVGPNANNVVAEITGNAIVNIKATGNNFNVGTGDAQGASLLVADNADINVPNTAASTGNVFIGRDTSTNTTFTMTGGTIDTGRNFLLGNATGATGIVGMQSGGTITTTLNFVVADTNGGSIYNLSGGSIVANGSVVVGRQTTAANSGVMNQTGGTLTSANGVSIGNAQDANTALWGTGIYNISGGTITANQTTGTALNIGPQGAGTFRVIGDDATIDINGNMIVQKGVSNQGTLAYQFETGDLLSMIDVSGNATFNAGSILDLDTTVAPTQSSYDLVTALDIIDNGLVFNEPGWSFSIVPGGNGEILRISQAVGVPGDYNNNGTVDAADYVLYREGVQPLPANEVDNVGTTNDQDWVEWKARFGNPNPGAGGDDLNASQVPEPATAGLVILAVMALTAAGRRLSLERRR
jgi:hypothetical protein